MATPAPVELPAARLRVGDVLVAFGEHATIVRPPVVSVDGAMINALIVDAATTGSTTGYTPDTTQQTRLVRLPVGLRVQVVRPSAGEYAFVRGTKTARSSGARIAVLDLHHPDSEIPPTASETFATLCTTHHTLKAHAGISTATAQATHPEQWCNPCAETTLQRAHERVYGTATNDTATEATA